MPRDSIRPPVIHRAEDRRHSSKIITERAFNLGYLRGSTLRSKEVLPRRQTPQIIKLKLLRKKFTLKKKSLRRQKTWRPREDLRSPRPKSPMAGEATQRVSCERLNRPPTKILTMAAWSLSIRTPLMDREPEII
jgi:hypothetical protein